MFKKKRVQFSFAANLDAEREVVHADARHRAKRVPGPDGRTAHVWWGWTASPVSTTSTNAARTHRASTHRQIKSAFFDIWAPVELLTAATAQKFLQHARRASGVRSAREDSAISGVSAWQSVAGVLRAQFWGCMIYHAPAPVYGRAGAACTLAHHAPLLVGLGAAGKRARGARAWDGRRAQSPARMTCRYM